MMQTRLKVAIAALLLPAGCARFGDQTSLSEPHALVRFEIISPDVRTFDGLPVRAGKYRVKAGRHELVYRVLESRQKVAKPVSLGIMTLPPALEEQQFRSRYATNVVLIEAGWLYDVEGVEVKKTMFLGQ